MADPAYEIRHMRKEDIPKALDVWRETGLQEGTHCLYTWLQVDPLGFQVAVTDSGEVVGVCGAVHHHEDLAFVGCYAVRKKCRGTGIGIKLWKASMDHVGRRNAALNAVPDKLELYRDRGGFPLVESAWTNCVNETVEDVDPDVLLTEVPGVDVRPVLDSDLPTILDYDSNLMGYDRHVAIRATLQEEDSRSFIAVQGQDGACLGYGTIKTSCQGVGLVGPLYAETSEVAEVLVRSLILALPRVKGFAMMTVSSNAGAKAIIDKLKVPTFEECPRCYTTSKVPVDTNKVFGHLDLNFSPF